MAANIFFCKKIKKLQIYNGCNAFRNGNFTTMGTSNERKQEGGADRHETLCNKGRSCFRILFGREHIFLQKNKKITNL